MTPQEVQTIIDKASDLGLYRFLMGSCGPSAIAINHVLFEGRGVYVVIKAKNEWVGHVALLVDGVLYDYTGKTDFNYLVAHKSRPDEPFEIRTHVPESQIRRHFCTKHCRLVEEAVFILQNAKAVIELDDTYMTEADVTAAFIATPAGKMTLQRLKAWDPKDPNIPSFFPRKAS